MEIKQKIKYLATESLKFHPDNPRLIKDQQFKTLCESIKTNPDYFETRPILCNKDLVVFAGNMRLRAALEIGLTEVPCAIMDIPEKRQREIMIRDNVQSGEWQSDILANNFDTGELIDWGIDAASLGLVESGIQEKTAKDQGICERCQELKKGIDGHHHRTGHVPSPLPKVSPKTTPPPENSVKDDGGGE